MANFNLGSGVLYPTVKNMRHVEKRRKSIASFKTNDSVNQGTFMEQVIAIPDLNAAFIAASSYSYEANFLCDVSLYPNRMAEESQETKVNQALFILKSIFHQTPRNQFQHSIQLESQSVHSWRIRF